MGKTIDELLKEALVPVEEQPYEVPGNWVWSRLEFLINKINYGYTESATIENIGPKFLRITDIKDNGVDWNTVPYCKINDKDLETFRLYDKDIVIARMGSVGKSYLVIDPQESVFASYLIRLKLNNLIMPEYLNIFNNSLCYWNQITINIKGTTRPNVNANVLKGLKIPLPPLPEQQRIVTKIESLFSKIDKAKELIEEAREEFENRKSAILAKAFRGELTEKWREENLTIEPVIKHLNEVSSREGKKIKSVNYGEDNKIPYEIPKTWEWLELQSIGSLERGRSKHRPRNDERLFGGPYPFIQTGDVARSGVEIQSHSQTLSEFGLQQSKLFPKGTVCITIAANIGDTGILTYDCCFPDSVVGFTPNELTISRYVNYYLNVIKGDLEHYAPATAQKNINLGILKDIIIPVAPLEEQTQMVKIIDELLYQESRIEELTQLEEQIELLKKSILAKAFRGKLGTNDPTEESAIELLKEVLLEKNK